MTRETDLYRDENENLINEFGLPTIVHGVNCTKVRHGIPAMFIHEPDHDGPYKIGLVPYCGRCHARLA